MDLEMIQDLLGTSNLPPPPSVQDLLGDVVPIARSPSPPSASFTSLRLSVEHSYSKVRIFITLRLNSFPVFELHERGVTAKTENLIDSLSLT